MKSVGKLFSKRIPLLAWIFLGGALVLLGTSPITDSDVFMHLALGREFFRHGVLPLVDPFIVSQFRDWTAWHEWGGYVLLYSIYLVGGYAGLAVFKIFLAGSALLPAALNLRRSDLQASWPLFILCFLGLIALGLRFSERTSFIADVLLALTVATVLTDWKSRSRWTWLLPILLFTWINIHGSFFLGWAVVGIWILSLFVVRGWTEAKDRLPVFIACFLAPILNPRGLDALVSPFKFLDFREVFLQHIVLEWRPTFSSSSLVFTETWIFGAFLVLSALLVLTSLRQRAVREKVPYVLLTVFLIALGLSANRFIPGAVFGLILVAVLLPLRTPTYDLKLWIPLMITSACLAGIISSGQYLRAGMPHRLGVGIDERVFPSEETIEKIKSSPDAGPIRNSYYFGCYLAWMLDGKRKIFVHGYVTDMRVLQENFSGFGGSREKFDLDTQKWGTSGVIVERRRGSSGLIEILKNHPDWSIASADKASVLFLKKE